MLTSGQVSLYVDNLGPVCPDRCLWNAPVLPPKFHLEKSQRTKGTTGLGRDRSTVWPNSALLFYAGACPGRARSPQCPAGRWGILGTHTSHLQASAPGQPLPSNARQPRHSFINFNRQPPPLFYLSLGPSTNRPPPPPQLEHGLFILASDLFWRLSK